MENKDLKKRGFTLLEVMVVVAIISIMSVTVVIGFNSFGKTIQLQETAGVIEDVIKKLELEVSQGEYEKNIIHFEKDFLVVESEPKDMTLKLDYKGLGTEGCNEGEVAMKIKEIQEVVYLTKKDIKGNNLEIKPFKTEAVECVSFIDSKATGFQFQTSFNSKKSPALRLFHFNLNRSNLADGVEISAGTEYSLELQEPYGKKTYLKNGIETPTPITLTLKNEEGKEEEIKLN